MRTLVGIESEWLSLRHRTAWQKHIACSTVGPVPMKPCDDDGYDSATQQLICECGISPPPSFTTTCCMMALIYNPWLCEWHTEAQRRCMLSHEPKPHRHRPWQPVCPSPALISPPGCVAIHTHLTRSSSYLAEYAGANNGGMHTRSPAHDRPAHVHHGRQSSALSCVRELVLGGV